jgi:exo-beta-1,3-glucanase (GH17 family)
MSHHQQERETTMKNQLIIAFAICVLFLSACGSLVGTNAPSSNSPAHSAAPSATASTQSACSALEESQAQLNQEYHAAGAQLAAAQARGNLQQAAEAETRLIRLHQGVAWVHALLKAC